MTTGSIKIIKRPPPAKIQFKSVQDAITKELKGVARLHLQERARIVSGFKTKIQFGNRISLTEKQVTLSIVVENSGTKVSDNFTVGDLWQALDKTGTRPHLIKPRRPGGSLRFQTGYQPRTRPIGRFGGPGVANGPVVFARSVKHPGFAPRKFSEGINKRLRPAFEKAITRGISLGLKRRG